MRASARLLAGTVLAAFLLPLAPVGAADPVSDAQRWAGCADWIAEQTLGALQPYRDVAYPIEKVVKCKLRMRATPIVIDDASDIYLVRQDGVAVPNAANGVTGDGTDENPWTIGGHEFDGRTVGCPMIAVRDIRVRLHVSVNWIHDAPCAGGSILIERTSTVEVHDNLISASRTGILLRDTVHLYVHDNVLEGGYGLDAAGAAVGERTGEVAIQVEGGFRPYLIENVIRRGTSSEPYSYSIGVAAYGVGGLASQYNDVEDVGTAFRVHGHHSYGGIWRDDIRRAAVGLELASCTPPSEGSFASTEVNFYGVWRPFEIEAGCSFYDQWTDIFP